MRKRDLLQLVASCLLLSLAGSNVHAQTPVPVRELPTPTATSVRAFGLILNVREIAGGRVLVNDGSNRQIVLLDQSLSGAKIVLDSAAADQSVGTPGSYGPRPSPLLQYLGDTTMFVDRASSTLLLISPSGEPLRTVAPPHASVIGALTASSSAVDGEGSLIYKAPVYARELPLSAGSNTIVATSPDSAAIARANFDTRRIDTIARVKLNAGTRTENTITADTVRARHIISPLSYLDEWAILSDGTIAIVRGFDYHIDWIHADGSRTSTPKLPFDFRPLTDADKQQLADSALVAYEKVNGPPGSKAITGELGRRRTEVKTYESLPLSQLGDYQPPIRYGAVKADLDNNLWILPTTSAQSKAGELVYDVVNKSGTLTHRVRLPLGHSVASFGHGGVVYLMSKDADGWRLKRTVVPK
jgi:hypothetical protein